MIRTFNGDCLEVMQTIADESIDTVVTDPPYGLSFMGKKWDYDVPGVEIWRECLRVLKPGGHLLSFAGTRTQHRMCCNIEDAGFEIRDMIAWVYGSGFPKSLDVSKAIDKAAGAEREVIGPSIRLGDKKAYKVNPTQDGASWQNASANKSNSMGNITKPATAAAEQWQGFGTALKPALEPITVARKPLSEKTVAANVLKWGTGVINIDSCRIGLDGRETQQNPGSTQGRWPTNLIHDGSREVLDEFPDRKVAPRGRPSNGKKATGFCGYNSGVDYRDQGSAARFFYCAKASKRERGTDNDHPTVKPLALMQYLCKLVTPPGGIALDPFMGSGTTGVACANLDRSFIGIEMSQAYHAIADERITDAIIAKGTI